MQSRLSSALFALKKLISEDDARNRVSATDRSDSRARNNINVLVITCVYIQHPWRAAYSGRIKDSRSIKR